MNMARSTFYKRPHAGHRAAREKADTDLRVRIEDILAEFPAYGYRRVTHELRRRGLVINHKRVARVMREHALTPHRVRAWLATTNSDHKQPIYPNLRSSITPEGPDELWVADLTYIRLTTGFVFLAVVLDAWSRRVIGYAISHLLDTRLCLAALDAALDLRQPRAGLVHHSDRGVQGGFKRSLQRLDREELRWKWANVDGRIVRYVRVHLARRPPSAFLASDRPEAAVAAGVSPAVGSRWFSEYGGMPSFPIGPLSGRYLSFVEREELAPSRRMREIARRLDRSPSTISRERRRNSRSGVPSHDRAVEEDWPSSRRTTT